MRRPLSPGVRPPYLPCPIAPAVYRIEHPAGFRYVGASIRPQRRHNEWARVFADWDAGKPRLSLPFAWSAALREVGTANWSFVIVERFPAPPVLDGDAMWRAENAEISRVLSVPSWRCLNVTSACVFRPAYARLVPSTPVVS